MEDTRVPDAPRTLRSTTPTFNDTLLCTLCYMPSESGWSYLLVIRQQLDLISRTPVLFYYVVSRPGGGRKSSTPIEFPIQLRLPPTRRGGDFTHVGSSTTTNVECRAENVTNNELARWSKVKESSWCISLSRSAFFRHRARER